MAEAEIFMNDIVESAGANIPENERAMERLIAKACRSSVKANDRLDALEIGALLKSLAECDNPYNCPHGRPVFIRMTKYELEHSFGRV
jgi:DNA mismatch repair protein MutL